MIYKLDKSIFLIYHLNCVKKHREKQVLTITIQEGRIMDVTKRVKVLRKEMREQDIGLSLILGHENMFYYTNYKAIIYSRHIMIAINEKTVNAIVPGLEEDHSKAHCTADNIFVYYEHPEKKEKGPSHMYFLDELTEKLGRGAKIGVEFGIISMSLAAYLERKGFVLHDIGPFIEHSRYIKSEEEKELMRLSGKIVSGALAASINNCKSGMTEMDMDALGNAYIMEETPKMLPGATLDIFVMSPGGLARTNMPHVFSNTRRYEENEVILHSRQVGINGYRAEIERTFFLGKPSDKQKEIYKVMTEAQQTMLDGIRPGITAGEADSLGRKVIQKAGLGEYSNHRCGHGIGLGLHEPPYLRFDNDLILEENMSFSIEPGIYIPELGGFRHSDTVILTKNGSEKITSFKRELDELIL